MFSPVTRELWQFAIPAGFQAVVGAAITMFPDGGDQWVPGED